ncbi:MAG: VCBS repeat-containing protein [Candidatus Zixiibacteriota bacterium]|nr:MAG: VCBS repeat-containing protein [candidate division Zixibacteria bacterium]
MLIARKLTVTLLILFAGSLASAATFDPPVKYSTGEEPGAFCSADFDGDGHPDLAVTHQDWDLLPVMDPNSGVSILLNNGDGTFASAVEYAIGDCPTVVCSGDFDHDGDIDLAASMTMWDENKKDSLRIWDNDGNGVFTLMASYESTLKSSRDICAADFNGDTYDDLAMAGYANDTVCIFLNDGAGAFTLDTSFTAGESIMRLCASDLNSDGNCDLAVTSTWDPANSIWIFTNDGSADFTLENQIGGGYAGFSGICASDINDDGDKDLVLADQSIDMVTVFDNYGDATFADMVFYPVLTMPYSISMADFDSDGYDDVAVTCHTHDTVSILINDGDGGFTLDSKYEVCTRPIFLNSEDYDGDGKVDLAVVNTASNDVAILMNTTVLTAIGEDTETFSLPDKFELRQNYPNPFNPFTTIGFDLPSRSGVDITIYNISGQAVRHLLNAELPAGTHNVAWNGTNDEGIPVATGVYLCRLKAGDQEAIKKMALLK